MMSIAKHHTRDTTPWSCGATATPTRGGDLAPVHIVLDRPQRNNRLENKAPRIVINVDAAAQVRGNALDQDGAEALALRPIDRRTVVLLPDQMKLALSVVMRNRPRHGDVAEFESAPYFAALVKSSWKIMPNGTAIGALNSTSASTMRNRD